MKHLLTVASLTAMVLCSAALMLPLQAQEYPLELTISILPPYSPLLADWEAHPERVQLLVRNINLSRRFEFRLGGLITSDDGTIRIRSKDNAAMRVFEIQPGGVLNLSGSDWNLFDQNQVEGSGVDRDLIARTGRLPEGSYNFCAWALEYTSHTPLSAPRPTGCTGVQIQFGEAPVPLSPVCGEPLTMLLPQLAIFQWLPAVAGVPPHELGNLRYELLLVPVPLGKTPETAIESPGDPPFLRVTDLTSALYTFTAADPLLESGITYAWRVRVYDVHDRVVFRNDGKSEVCAFTFQAMDPVCFVLTPFTPVDKSTTTSGLPKFAVALDRPIRPQAVTGGSVRVWRTDSYLPTGVYYGQRYTARWIHREPELVFEHTFRGNTDRHILLRTHAGRSICELRFLNHTGSDTSFTPVKNTRYVWDATLAFDNTSILSNGTHCILSEVTSSRGSFDNMASVGSVSAECLEPCTTTSPTDKTPSKRVFRTGDTVRIGKFNMLLGTVQLVAGNLRGDGEIQIPFLNELRVRVGFTNLKINNNNVVYAGWAVSKSWSASGSPALSYGTPPRADALRLSQQTVTQQSAWVSRLHSQTTDLPVGFDNVVEGRRMVIGIMAMSFEATKASVLAQYYEDMPWLGSFSGAGLAFSGVCCLQPNGLDKGDAELPLLQSASSFGSSTTITYTFKPEGTKMRWNCAGFKDIVLDMTASFPIAWLTPMSAAGQPNQNENGVVKAKVTTTVANLSNWIAPASFNGKITLAGLEGMAFTTGDMFFDASATRDPDGCVLPTWESTAGDRGAWRGFISSRCFASHEALTRANGAPIEFVVRACTIGSMGVSIQMLDNAANQGSSLALLGGWGANGAQAELSVRNNSVTNSRLIGSVLLPVTNQAQQFSGGLVSQGTVSTKCFSYSFASMHGTVCVPVGRKYPFTLTRRAFDFTLWNGTATPSSAAVVTVENEGNGPALAKTDLGGSFTFNTAASGIPLFKLPDFNFQRMTIKQLSGGVIFMPGIWTTAPGQAQMTVAGFPVSSFCNQRIYMNGNEHRLQMGASFGLSAGSSYFSADGSFSTVGRITTSSGYPRPEFIRHQVDDINLDAELAGSFAVKGTLTFYRDNAQYGNGFRGVARATFEKKFLKEIEGVFQVGNMPVSSGGSDRYRYWFFDTRARFADPRPITHTFGWYGFGGGVYYKMRRNDVSLRFPISSPSSSPIKTIGASLSGHQYYPDASKGIGFKAMGTFAPLPAGASEQFNCDAQIDVLFNASGGMSGVTVDGWGYLMSKLDDRSKYVAKLEAEIDYSFGNMELTGFLLLTPSWPFEQCASNTQAAFRVSFDNNKWYFKLGDAFHPVSIDLGPFHASGYVMTGNDLFSSTVVRDGNFGSTKLPRYVYVRHNYDPGFILGADINYEIEEKFSFGFGYIKGWVTISSSIRSQLSHHEGSHCGFDPVGFDGWYMTGSLNTSVEAGFRAGIDGFGSTGSDFDIEVPMDFGAPKPLWISIPLHIKTSVLGQKINKTITLRLGSECYP